MIKEYVEKFRKKGPTALADLSDEEQAAVAIWSRKVVDEYGSILVEHPAKIKDVDALPFTKDTIKIAIKTLMLAYALTDSEDMLTLLKDRYVRLSSFQVMGREEIKTDYTETGDPNQALPDSNTASASTRQKYMQLVLSEEKILFEDIENYLSDL
ncbi:MAG: hypothetical protein LJE94_17150 [Deltaproteobacteria bacterium]|nr:hypothetical protein [Deltaproteobacteria bacterium]